MEICIKHCLITQGILLSRVIVFFHWPILLGLTVDHDASFLSQWRILAGYIQRPDITERKGVGIRATHDMVFNFDAF